MDINSINKNMDEIVILLKALANEKRLTIICALVDEEKCVGDLEEIVGLSQSALSQHLARLRRDGLVKTRRDAQTIYYSLDSEHVSHILGSICKLFHEVEVEVEVEDE